MLIYNPSHRVDIRTNLVVILLGVLLLVALLMNKVRFESLNAVSTLPVTYVSNLSQTASITQEQININIAKLAGPSVVTVAQVLPVSQQRQELGNNFPKNIGSGFIITQDGFIVTSKHVVSDISGKYQILLADGTEYAVTNVYLNPKDDLAIIKINTAQHSNKDLKPIALGDSSNLKVGEHVLAIGTALGQFSDTVTSGIISGLGRNIQAQSTSSNKVEQLNGLIQTSAAINPGNSGGPLVDDSGRVIGVSTAIDTSAENIGFAIPINQVENFISTLEVNGSF